MRRAFTLIELIIVMAVVGLLIGILTPALAGAMNSAQRAKCMSNLRGFGPALSMYMDSAGSGILPVAPGYSPRQDNVIGYTRFYVAIEDYLDVPLPPRKPDGGFSGAFGPYLCPRDPGFGEDHGFSYSYHAGLHMAPVWDVDAVDPREGRRIRRPTACSCSMPMTGTPSLRQRLASRTSSTPMAASTGSGAIRHSFRNRGLAADRLRRLCRTSLAHRSDANALR